MNTTKKQKYHLPYEIHHWGWIEVEEETYYEAMECGWDALDGSFTVPDGGCVEGSEFTLDDTWTKEWENPEETWEKPKVTCKGEE